MKRRMFFLADQNLPEELKEELLKRPEDRVYAVATGEVRPPKKGEWFLSGAVIEAYRAIEDLSQEYHIARLVLDQSELG